LTTYRTVGFSRRALLFGNTLAWILISKLILISCQFQFFLHLSTISIAVKCKLLHTNVKNWQQIICTETKHWNIFGDHLGVCWFFLEIQIPTGLSRSWNVKYSGMNHDLRQLSLLFHESFTFRNAESSTEQLTKYKYLYGLTRPVPEVS
jgi:hypothetical protein